MDDVAKISMAKKFHKIRSKNGINMRAAKDRINYKVQTYYAKNVRKLDLSPGFKVVIVVAIARLYGMGA